MAYCIPVLAIYSQDGELYALKFGFICRRAFRDAKRRRIMQSMQNMRIKNRNRTEVYVLIFTLCCLEPNTQINMDVMSNIK